MNQWSKHQYVRTIRARAIPYPRPVCGKFMCCQAAFPPTTGTTAIFCYRFKNAKPCLILFMTTEPGEVYLLDLGIAGKKRPVLIVSRKDDAAPRALSICAPLTTSNRGSAYEVPLGKSRFLDKDSFVNVQGLQAVGHHELTQKLGRISAADLSEVKKALAWSLDL